MPKNSFKYLQDRYPFILKDCLCMRKFAKRAKIPVGNIKVLFHFHCDKQNWIPLKTIYKARCVLFIQVNYKKSKIYQLTIVVACT